MVDIAVDGSALVEDTSGLHIVKACRWYRPRVKVRGRGRDRDRCRVGVKG